MNTLGQYLRLTSYGESHGKVIGAVLDGFPSGFEVDVAFIQTQLSRRKPGQSKLTTTRKEEDEVVIDSGVFEDLTTGTPIHFQIKNKDQKPKDYDKLKEVYRPSHADYTYDMRYGFRDHRGGGRSSARVTASWVAAGALVQDFLNQSYDIQISAYVKQVGNVVLDAAPTFYSRQEVDESLVRCPDKICSNKMISAIEEAKQEKDSLGGVIECVISGVPAGVGDPVFGKINAKLGHAMLSINATKGFEIGGGFALSALRGSETNDGFEYIDGLPPQTVSNNSGGVQGGITNGMDIVFRVAFKPTATIGLEQDTIDDQGNAVKLEATGRHDPCVVPRAVPIVETLAALVLGDVLV